MAKDIHLRNTIYLSTVESFWGFGMNAVSMGTILPVFLARCGADNAAIALVPALSALGAGLPQSFSGLIARGGGRMKPWVMWLHVISPAPLLLVAAWLFWGGGSRVRFVLASWGIFYGLLGLLFPVWLEYMARILDPSKRGRAFGIIFFSQTISGIGSVALASLLLKWSTSDAVYASLFFVAWAAMAGGSLFFLGTVETPPPGLQSRVRPTLRGHIGDTLRLLSEMRWMRSYMPARLIVRGVYPLMISFYAVYAVKACGADASTAALFGAAALVCQALAGVGAGHLGDRFGHKLPVMLGQACLALSGILVQFPLPAWAFFAVASLTGVFLATEYTSQTNWVMDLSGGGDRQSVLALVGFLLTPASVLAPIAGGYLMDSVGFKPVALAMSALLLAAMFLESLTSHRPAGAVGTGTR